MGSIVFPEFVLVFNASDQALDEVVALVELGEHRAKIKLFVQPVLRLSEQGGQRSLIISAAAERGEVQQENVPTVDLNVVETIWVPVMPVGLL